MGIAEPTPAGKERETLGRAGREKALKVRWMSNVNVEIRPEWQLVKAPIYVRYRGPKTLFL